MFADDEEEGGTSPPPVSLPRRGKFDDEEEGEVSYISQSFVQQ